MRLKTVAQDIFYNSIISSLFFKCKKSHMAEAPKKGMNSFFDSVLSDFVFLILHFLLFAYKLLDENN